MRFEWRLVRRVWYIPSMTTLRVLLLLVLAVTRAGGAPMPAAGPASVFAGGLAGPEGLAFLNDGTLAVGSTTGRIMRLAADGSASTLAESRWPASRPCATAGCWRRRSAADASGRWIRKRDSRASTRPASPAPTSSSRRASDACSSARRSPDPSWTRPVERPSRPRAASASRTASHSAVTAFSTSRSSDWPGSLAAGDALRGAKLSR